MANTTNFGWETPDDTDLVKDGALAMRTLGNAIDTSLVDLKGGTTGQILAKNSNTDMDFVWIANDQGDITSVTAGTGLSGGGTSGAVTLTNTVATAYDAKGDLIVGTGADTFAKLTVGTNGDYLVADSTTTTGLKWVAPGGSGALTLIKRASFSNVANTGTTFDNVFTSTYKSYLMIIENIYAATNTDDLQLQFRASGSTTTTAYYGNYFGYALSTTLQSTFTNNGSSLTLANNAGDVGSQGSGEFTFYEVGNTTQAKITGNFYAANAGESGVIGGSRLGTNFDGFLLKSSSSNITGTVAVYGLAAA